MSLVIAPYKSFAAEAVNTLNLLSGSTIAVLHGGQGPRPKQSEAVPAAEEDRGDGKEHHLPAFVPKPGSFEELLLMPDCPWRFVFITPEKLCGSSDLSNKEDAPRPLLEALHLLAERGHLLSIVLDEVDAYFEARDTATETFRKQFFEVPQIMHMLRAASLGRRVAFLLLTATATARELAVLFEVFGLSEDSTELLRLSANRPDLYLQINDMTAQIETKPTTKHKYVLCRMADDVISRLHGDIRWQSGGYVGVDSITLTSRVLLVFFS